MPNGETVSNLTSNEFWRKHGSTEVRRLNALWQESSIQHEVERMHRLLTGAEVYDITREDLEW